MLALAGYDFQVASASVEELAPGSLPMPELCMTNALLKAEEVALRFPLACVIGADTLVKGGDKTLGKPRDLDDARDMLHFLSGQVQTVCTGVAVLSGGAETVFHELTRVQFKKLTSEMIESYMRLVNVLDKAGAYAIQEHGEMLVESVEGDRDNVIGLPVKRLAQVLASSMK